jgi:hypothetical protein
MSQEELWDGEISLAFMQDSADKLQKSNIFPELARKQEIFLDLLSSYCSTMSGPAVFLMNPRYQDALSSGELEMKALISEIAKSMNK